MEQIQENEQWKLNDNCKNVEEIIIVQNHVLVAIDE